MVHKRKIILHNYCSGKIGGHVQNRFLSPYISSILPTLGQILLLPFMNG